MSGTERKSKVQPRGITSIAVQGYKSLVQRTAIEVAPLTILAGANSSGKSSIMQPLLLLKQTLDASYDPGALLLDGPNVRYTSVRQFLPLPVTGYEGGGFIVQIATARHGTAEICFDAKPLRIAVERVVYGWEDEEIVVHPAMTAEAIMKHIPEELFQEDMPRDLVVWDVARERCFLKFRLSQRQKRGSIGALLTTPFDERVIREVIHLPGLRGTPERTYPLTTAVGPVFQGVFQNYFASVIAYWQRRPSRKSRLADLSNYMSLLGLTSAVRAIRRNDTQVELVVGRSHTASTAGRSEMVSVADVGLGVSQTLPVVVALLAAKAGQMVYLEQPEIHLHPRAQYNLAQILVDAANRGVRVVCETHSSLLLLGIQALVAESKLEPELTRLHWFTRNKNGCTSVASAQLDEAGRFGTWPADFGDVALELQNRYLNAAESRFLEGQK